MRRWAPVALAALVVGALAVAQSGTAVQFIQRAVLDLTRGGTIGGATTVGGDLTVNGDAGVTKNVSITGTLASGTATINGNLTVNGDAGVTGKASTGDLTVNGDAGVGGSLAVGNATTALTVQAVSMDAGRLVSTGRICTDVACTTAYVANDGFGTLNLVGVVGGSSNWTTAGSFNTDDSLKAGATAVSGGNACAAGNEGKIRRDSASGGTSGARTRYCICTSDGAGTPAYAWQTIGTGTVGTTTACNP